MCFGGVPMGMVEGDGLPNTGETDLAGRERSLFAGFSLSLGMLIPYKGDEILK